MLAAPRSWTLSALARRDAAVERRFRFEAHELLRALAAQAVVTTRDAAPSEFEERLQTLLEARTPDDLIEGFTLKSSLGALLMAKLALGWAPPTTTALRAEPLAAPDLIAQLTALGAPPTLARDLSAGFAPDEDFERGSEGLSPGLLAGLAERTLTHPEAVRALTQVALSPRCLARLAMTCALLDGTRRCLPILPSPALPLSGASVTAFAALGLGESARALELARAGVGDPVAEALTLLLTAQLALEQGRPADLDDFPLAPGAALPVPDPASDDDEDAFLEVVEEQMATGLPTPRDTSPADALRLPVPPDWVVHGQRTRIEAPTLRKFVVARRAFQSPLAEFGAVLGIRARVAPRWVPTVPLPPDPSLLAAAFSERETRLADLGAVPDPVLERRCFAEVYLPPVVLAARWVAEAAEGRVAPSEVVETAGDLSWVLRRARALALAAQGDVAAALAEVETLGSAGAPEAHFARARSLRFTGRIAAPAERAKTRPLAAQIMADLAAQLGRTLSGVLG